MESGWEIADHSLFYGAGDREIRIPLRLQKKKSLVAEGSVRTISMEPDMVRVPEGKLKDDFEEKTIDTRLDARSSRTKWIRIHLSRVFQSPQYVTQRVRHPINCELEENNSGKDRWWLAASTSIRR